MADPATMQGLTQGPMGVAGKAVSGQGVSPQEALGAAARVGGGLPALLLGSLLGGEQPQGQQQPTVMQPQDGMTATVQPLQPLSFEEFAMQQGAAQQPTREAEVLGGYLEQLFGGTPPVWFTDGAPQQTTTPTQREYGPSGQTQQRRQR